MEDLSEKYDERTLRLIIETLLESGLEYDAEFDDRESILNNGRTTHFMFN